MFNWYLYSPRYIFPFIQHAFPSSAFCLLPSGKISVNGKQSEEGLGIFAIITQGGWMGWVWISFQYGQLNGHESKQHLQSLRFIKLNTWSLNISRLYNHHHPSSRLIPYDSGVLWYASRGSMGGNNSQRLNPPYKPSLHPHIKNIFSIFVLYENYSTIWQTPRTIR